MAKEKKQIATTKKAYVKKVTALLAAKQVYMYPENVEDVVDVMIGLDATLTIGKRRSGLVMLRRQAIDKALKEMAKGKKCKK